MNNRNLSLFPLSVIKKIAQYIGEVLEDSKDKVQENLLASGGRPCKTFMFLKCCSCVLISIQIPMKTDGINYAQMFRNCCYSCSGNSFCWQFLSHWNQGKFFILCPGWRQKGCLLICSLFQNTVLPCIQILYSWLPGPYFLVFIYSVKKKSNTYFVLFVQLISHLPIGSFCRKGNQLWVK